MSDARKIYQANLDAVSEALLNGDIDTIKQHIAIPNMMSTSDSEIVMASIEEFERVMMDFRDILLAKGMVGYRRTCLEAKFVTGVPDMVAGQHRTEVLGRDGLALPAYDNHSVVMRIDGRWMGIWLQASVENAKLQILSPDIAAAQAEARRLREMCASTAPAAPHTPSEGAQQ